MFRPRRALVLPFLAVLAGTLWIFWLRWPTFGHVFWNLDEGIYATVGRTVLEGGVMYRDAIDHRSPFCHYLTAGIFAVTGVNNAWAMHAVLAGMVALLAGGLFLLGRRWRDLATGAWAVAITGAYSTDLFYPGDAYSLGTEWGLALCSTWGAWTFWRGWERGSWRGCVVAGATYAAAFMFKQPGLLEVGAPIVLLLYAAATGRLARPLAARLGLALVGGHVALLLVVFGYFRAHGVLDDFYFYGWAYNLVFYGAGATVAERVEALLALPGFVLATYPLLLALTGFAILRVIHIITRDQPSAVDRERQPAAVFLLAWLVLSAAGAAAAGRVHPHYYIQALPPLVLAAAWALGSLTHVALETRRGWWRAAAGSLALVAAWNLFAHPAASRAHPPVGRDVGWVPADYVRRHTRPDDRIFVWGLYPDFYTFADRRPASRYIYTSFQTGVQPGRNTAAGVDTADVAVPGSLTALCAELAANPPLYFVDSSLGAQRLYEKYPLRNFRLLEQFVEENYVEVEPARFLPHGFRVLLLRDRARRAPGPGIEPGGAGSPAVPGVQCPPYVSGTAAEIDVRGGDATGGLQRLELLLDGAPVDAITFAPAADLHARFRLPLGHLTPGRHRVAARATSRGGATATSPAVTLEYTPDLLAGERLREFALPVIAAGHPPVRVTAPFGAIAAMEGGANVITANAPSLLTYHLAPRGARLTGRFGIRPGAYADANPGPTDGAEFVILWKGRGRSQVELLRRLLRPREVPAERGEQVFDLQLPADDAEGTLEFAIREGPHGNAASDWTYWSDLMLRPQQ